MNDPNNKAKMTTHPSTTSNSNNKATLVRTKTPAPWCPKNTSNNMKRRFQRRNSKTASMLAAASEVKAEWNLVSMLQQKVLKKHRRSSFQQVATALGGAAVTRNTNDIKITTRLSTLCLINESLLESSHFSFSEETPSSTSFTREPQKDDCHEILHSPIMTSTQQSQTQQQEEFSYFCTGRQCR